MSTEPIEQKISELEQRLAPVEVTIESPEWSAEMERRKEEMKRGAKISREDALAQLGLSNKDLAVSTEIHNLNH
jgi:hypothetical protein